MEETFLQGYITAALWSSVDDTEDPMDSNYDASDISTETLEQMERDCEAFQLDNKKLYIDNGWSNGYAGHDFWLTRNHHGCGFWDRDFANKKIGKLLTNKAEAFGEFNLYIGDDNLIYGC